MPKEISPIGHAAIDLLETKNWTFEQQTLELAQSQMAAQEVFEQQTDTRIMLGNEAAALVDRMRWLHRHTFLGRLSGCRGLVIPQENGNLATPSMFASDYEYVSDGKESDYIGDFYVFKVGRQNERQVLTINRRMTGQDSDIEVSVEYWNIGVLRNNGELVEVSFDSTATDEYKRKCHAEIFQKYIKNNPWLGEYYYNVSTNTEQPVVEKDIIAAASAVVINWNDPPPSFYASRPLNEGSIIQQLEHDLTRGVCWDYEDSSYLLPLGLVLRAQRALNCRQLFSKMVE